MTKPSVTSITVTLAYCMAIVQSTAFLVMFSLVYSFNPLGQLSFIGHMKFKLQLIYQVKRQQLSSNMV